MYSGEGIILCDTVLPALRLRYHSPTHTATHMDRHRARSTIGWIAKGRDEISDVPFPLWFIWAFCFVGFFFCVFFYSIHCEFVWCYFIHCSKMSLISIMHCTVWRFRLHYWIFAVDHGENSYLWIDKCGFRLFVFCFSITIHKPPQILAVDPRC